MKTKNIFTAAQLAAIQTAMVSEFEKWKAEKLEHRENHVNALINAHGDNLLSVLKLRQSAIHAIDQEIIQRRVFLDQLFGSISEISKVKTVSSD